MSAAKTATMLQGARQFGVDLQMGDDDELTYDARYEPSQGVLERIAVHKDAILALLKARRDASRIEWDKLGDITAEEYAALVVTVKDDLAALTSSLDRMERAAGVILPTMQSDRCSWRTAVQTLLAKRYNDCHARRRPKHVSDEDWLAALHAAHILGLRGPQPPRGQIP